MILIKIRFSHLVRARPIFDLIKNGFILIFPGKILESVAVIIINLLLSLLLDPNDSGDSFQREKDVLLTLNNQELP